MPARRTGDSGAFPEVTRVTSSCRADPRGPVRGLVRRRSGGTGHGAPSEAGVGLTALADFDGSPDHGGNFGRRRDRGRRARGYDHRLLPGEGAGAERRGGARRDRQPRVGLRVRRAQPAERLRHSRAPCRHRPGRDGVASRARQEPPRGDRDRRRLPRARVARPGPDRGGRPEAPGCAALAAAATGLRGALAPRGGGSPRGGAHRGRDAGGHAHRRGRRRRALSPGAGPHPGRRVPGRASPARASDRPAARRRAGHRCGPRAGDDRLLHGGVRARPLERRGRRLDRRADRRPSPQGPDPAPAGAGAAGRVLGRVGPPLRHDQDRRPLVGGDDRGGSGLRRGVHAARPATRSGPRS